MIHSKPLLRPPAKPKVAPFSYAVGDKDKKAVDPKTQKPGTRLVQVTPRGRELPYLVGKLITHDKASRAAAKVEDQKNGER